MQQVRGRDGHGEREVVRVQVVTVTSVSRLLAESDSGLTHNSKIFYEFVSFRYQ